MNACRTDYSFVADERHKFHRSLQVKRCIGSYYIYPFLQKKARMCQIGNLILQLCQVLFSKQTDSEMHVYGVQVTK